MRTLVRSIRSGEYLQSLETWTSSPELALDFGSMARAFEAVRRRGLRDMEFVLSDGPGMVSSVPVAKIGCEYHLPEPPFEPSRPKNVRRRGVKRLRITSGVSRHTITRGRPAKPVLNLFARK